MVLSAASEPPALKKQWTGQVMMKQPRRAYNKNTRTPLLLLLLLLLLQGYEVIYLTDVLDEYVMQQLPEYEDYKFVNIAKEDIEHLDKVKRPRGGGGA
jgi:hypothetical protein